MFYAIYNNRYKLLGRTNDTVNVGRLVPLNVQVQEHVKCDS